MTMRQLLRLRPSPVAASGGRIVDPTLVLFAGVRGSRNSALCMVHYARSSGEQGFTLCIGPSGMPWLTGDAPLPVREAERRIRRRAQVPGGSAMRLFVLIGNCE